MRHMPVLQTERLVIRPFEMGDLDPVHRILDREAFPSETSRAERAEWLQWTVLNYRQLALLDQPPYGDRAVALRSTGELVGAVGLVPYIYQLKVLPGFGGEENPVSGAEAGLFWAVSSAHRGQGIAAEAAARLIEHMFTQERIHRLIATTGHDNRASIQVMKKLGMQIERNPQPHPPWIQVVGILNNPESRG